MQKKTGGTLLAPLAWGALLFLLIAAALLLMRGGQPPSIPTDAVFVYKEVAP